MRGQHFIGSRDGVAVLPTSGPLRGIVVDRRLTRLVQDETLVEI